MAAGRPLPLLRRLARRPVSCAAAALVLAALAPLDWLAVQRRRSGPREQHVLPVTPLAEPLSLEALSWAGLVFSVDNFASLAECDLLRAEADELFAGTGHVDEPFRYETWQRRKHSATLELLEARVANLTGIPPHDHEGEWSANRMTPLADTRDRPIPLARSLHHDKNQRERRSVTVLLYLKSAHDADGGHTIFPALPRDGGRAQLGADPADPVARLARVLERAFQRGLRALTGGGAMQDGVYAEVVRQCRLARHGESPAIAVTPRAGRAILFWSDLPDGSPNRISWHAGCGAVGGEARYALQKFKEPLVGGAPLDRGEPGRLAILADRIQGMLP
jgi:hypothetical protein